MTLDDFRKAVQTSLKNERGVTDVAFTPLTDGVEQVSFWDRGVRGHFTVKSNLDKQALGMAVKAMADVAYEQAVEAKKESVDVA